MLFYFVFITYIQSIPYFQFRISENGPSLKCFEKDDIPVDTEEIFEEYCEDIHGNKYEEYLETTSCCECLRRVLLEFLKVSPYLLF